MSDGVSIGKIGQGTKTTPIQFNFSDPQDSFKKLALFGAQTYHDVKNNGISGMLSRGEVNAPSQSDSAATNL